MHTGVDFVDFNMLTLTILSSANLQLLVLSNVEGSQGKSIYANSLNFCLYVDRSGLVRVFVCSGILVVVSGSVAAR